MLAPQKLGESCEQGLRGEEAQKIVSAIFQLCLNASHSCTAPESPKQLWPLTPQLLTTPPFLAPSFSVSSVCTSHCFKTYPHLALSLLPLSLAFLCLLLLFMIFSLLPSAVLYLCSLLQADFLRAMICLGQSLPSMTVVFAGSPVPGSSMDCGH